VSRRILLVRHATAGSRAAWEGDDRLRPLDATGIQQTAWLTHHLADSRAGRMLSSPYLRCLQTVEPLAELLGLPVEACPELGEGTAGGTLDALMAGLRDEPEDCIVCTHGDVAAKLVGAGAECAKGSVWTLEWRDDGLVPIRYQPPVNPVTSA
jgi:8-oxo-(d)GTP phosphatase